MIYTVTVNPTVDVTNELEINDTVSPGTHRPQAQLRHAGGKGIDVARVIRNLGGRSVAMGFLGGFTGELVEGLLLQDGLELDFVDIRDETRTNVIIVVRNPSDSNRTTDHRFNSPGPKVQPFEFLRLCKKIRELAHAPRERRPTFAAICGSLCKEMMAPSYVAFVRYFKDMGAIVALDSSGKALEETLRYAPLPDIIKPNVDEFYELMGSRPVEGPNGAADCGIGYDGCHKAPSAFWKDVFAKTVEFRKRYPRVDALITLGGAGMLLLHDTVVLHARLDMKCEVRERSTVGAGDTALAGLLFELDTGHSWREALKLAIAAASAAVQLAGTESPTKEQVEKFLGHIEIHEHELSESQTTT